MLVSRYLVPAAPVAVPDGFARVDAAITGGLPHTIPLDQELSLIVSLPSGLARAWQESDPSAVVSRSQEELAPFTPAAFEPGSVARPPLRLTLRRGDRNLAALSPVAGLRQRIPASGALADVMILSWDLRAGSVRGGGDFGSRISLAWRRADAGADRFSIPAIHPNLLPRLASVVRFESELGLREPVLLKRFLRKKRVTQ